MTDERYLLEPYSGKRRIFTGVFDRYGDCFDGDRGQTLLIQGIELDGEEVCSHCWVQQAENFWPLDVKKGERVQFTAVVLPYKKRSPLVQQDGTYGIIDYGLYRPTAIHLIERVHKETASPQREAAGASSDHKQACRKKLAIVQDVQALVDEVGGVDELRKLIDFLA